MRLHADNLLGRRFTFDQQLTDTQVPDVTVVIVDDEKGIRVHALDGGKWWIPFATFRAALRAGILTESPKPPFVWPHGSVRTPTKTELARLNYTMASTSTNVKTLLQQLRRSL